MLSQKFSQVRPLLYAQRFVDARAMSAQNGSEDGGRAAEQAKYFPARKTPMLPAGTFDNKVAFITGGGTGLGKGMAFLLSKLGASVFITSRRLPVLQETAKEISALTGKPVVPFSADIRDPEAVKRAVDECVKTLGLPNLIVNNAAGNFISPTEKLSPNAWKTIVDIVLNGTAYVTLDIGKRLIEAKQGAVFLSITTIYATMMSGFVCPSAAAKSGVQTMTKSLASEWGRYGIRLNCIAPGGIETEGAFSRLDPTGQMRKMGLSRIPTARLGEIEELANLASYMLSDYSNWMSGEIVTLDGGELPFISGTFNPLVELEMDSWEAIREMITSSNKKSKM